MTNRSSSFGFFLVAPILTVVACAAPQNRVETGLVKAGLSPRMARCMAPRLTDRLSTAQLRQLQSLSRTARGDVTRKSIDELLQDMRALDDPEIVAVTSKAAIVCALDI